MIFLIKDAVSFFLTKKYEVYSTCSVSSWCCEWEIAIMQENKANDYSYSIQYDRLFLQYTIWQISLNCREGYIVQGRQIHKSEHRTCRNRLAYKSIIYINVRICMFINQQRRMTKNHFLCSLSKEYQMTRNSHLSSTLI